MQKTLSDYIQELANDVSDVNVIMLRKNNMKNNHCLGLERLPLDKKLTDYYVYDHKYSVVSYLKITETTSDPDISENKCYIYKPTYEELFITEWERIN
jgi:hypothetical protein